MPFLERNEDIQGDGYCKSLLKLNKQYATIEERLQTAIIGSEEAEPIEVNIELNTVFISSEVA